MKTYKLIGINQKIKIHYVAGGAVIVMHDKNGDRNQINAQSHEPGHLVFSIADMGEDLYSSKFLPIKLQVYDVQEAAFGASCMSIAISRGGPEIIESMAEYFQPMFQRGEIRDQDGIQEHLLPTMLPHLEEIESRLKTPLLSPAQRDGAMRYFAGALADAVMAQLLHRQVKIRLYEWSPKEGWEGGASE